MTTIDDYLERARSQLSRITIDELDAELAAGAVLVDIRPNELRSRDGEIPGALVIDRNVLEWRVAQSSDARQIDLADDQKVIVFCDEGYASSLAAVTLQALGIRGATDLVGGYQAWLSR